MSPPTECPRSEMTSCLLGKIQIKDKKFKDFMMLTMSCDYTIPWSGMSGLKKLISKNFICSCVTT